MFLQRNRFNSVQNRFPRCHPDSNFARISNFSLKQMANLENRDFLVFEKKKESVRASLRILLNIFRITWLPSNISFSFLWYFFDCVLMRFGYFGVVVGCLVYKGWSREIALCFFMVFATRRGCSRIVLGTLQGDIFSKKCQKLFLSPNRLNSVQTRFPRCPPGWNFARISNFTLKTAQHFKLWLYPTHPFQD